MSTDLTPEPRNPKELELYDLKAEPPRWELAFDANPKLYSKRGLRDFLTYLDDVLRRPNVGPATQEKFQAKRDEVQLVLDAKTSVDADDYRALDPTEAD